MWNLRLEELKSTQSEPRTITDLEKVLKNLKSNKTRDPHGVINEIFKPGIIGQDLKMTMLKLINCIKIDLHTPKFLQYTNITTIWKKKGSRQVLDNEFLW